MKTKLIIDALEPRFPGLNINAIFNIMTQFRLTTLARALVKYPVNISGYVQKYRNVPINAVSRDGYGYTFFEVDFTFPKIMQFKEKPIIPRVWIPGHNTQELCQINARNLEFAGKRRNLNVIYYAFSDSKLLIKLPNTLVGLTTINKLNIDVVLEDPYTFISSEGSKFDLLGEGIEDNFPIPDQYLPELLQLGSNGNSSS